MSLLTTILYPNHKFSDAKLAQVLVGKTVLITGASFGIGRLLAEKLAYKDTQLILMGRTFEQLEEVCTIINTKGGNAQYIAGDLRDKDTIEALFNTLKQQNILVDIFVNNAGNSIRRSIYQSLDRFHDFTRTMGLNYFAPVELGLNLLPGLTERKGQIINISSFIVLLPAMPLWSAYQASKGAFHIWLKSIQQELTLKGVACNHVYLPLVRTRMIAPTKKYENSPVMEPEQAMTIIVKCLLNRKYNYTPWWIPCMKFAFRVYGKTYAKKILRRK